MQLAKRKITKRRAATRTVTRYAKPKGGFGNLKPVIDGLLAGGAGQILQRWLGEFGHPVATVGVGFWQNNTTLKTEGSRELGALIATKIPFIGGGESPYAGRNY